MKAMAPDVPKTNGKENLIYKHLLLGFDFPELQ